MMELLISACGDHRCRYSPNVPVGDSPDPGGDLYQVGGINGLGHQRGVPDNPANPSNPNGHVLRDPSTDTSWNPAIDDRTVHAFGGERNPDIGNQLVIYRCIAVNENQDSRFAALLITLPRSNRHLSRSSYRRKCCQIPWVDGTADHKSRFRPRLADKCL
jgi:hypothetical protein